MSFVTQSKIRNLIKLVSFYSKLITKENLVDYIKKWSLEKEHNQAAILGNGPSLNESLKNFSEDYISSNDFFAVNNFCTHDMYAKIKPRNYVMSDPMFFEPLNVRYQEQQKVWDKLIESTNWQMSIFVPYCYFKNKKVRDISINKKLNLVPFHSIPFLGSQKATFSIYKKGLGNGEYATVVLHALYIAIQQGYKVVDFYGIDHNFFDGLYVDENNVLYSRQTHFDEDIKKRLCFCYGKDFSWQPYTMDVFLQEKSFIFYGHKIMNAYAVSKGCRVYNCTSNTLVDAYERKSMK